MSLFPAVCSREVFIPADESHDVGIWWITDANAAYLRAQYDDFSEVVDDVLVSRNGNRPANVPERAANVWLSWAVAPGWQVRGEIGRAHV